MDEATIDISKMDKAEVLVKLYSAARPMGMGLLQARGDLSIEEARKLLGDERPTNDLGFPRRDATHFDYLYGRPLKIDLSGDKLDPRLYDRDHGNGAAARALGVK